MVSVRGSIRLARRSRPCTARPASVPRRRSGPAAPAGPVARAAPVAGPPSAAATARAVSATSPEHAEVRPAGARRSRPGRRPPARPWPAAPISLPCRVVHMFSEQPQPTITSARADQLGRQRRGEPAAHVQVPRAAAEQALGHRRGGQQRPARVGEPLQVGRGRPPGAPAGDEHRPPGAAPGRRPARPTASAAGAARAVSGGAGAGRRLGHAAACTSSGRPAPPCGAARRAVR